MDLRRQPPALTFDLCGVEPLAHPGRGNAGRQEVTEQRQHGRGGGVERQRRLGGGHHHSHQAPSVTSGSTSHDCAAGRKGLETSQLASSRKRIGAPLATASSQASSSNATSSRGRKPALSRRGDEPPQARALLEAGQVEHDDIQGERLAHLVQGPLREVAEAPRADESARDPPQRSERRQSAGVRRVGRQRDLADGPLLTRHEPVHDTASVPIEDRLVRVLIADDHRLMRDGTAALLASDERVEVVGLAADGSEAIALAERRRPDVALLDLNMPGVSGIEACAAIRQSCPATEVMILTVSSRSPTSMPRSGSGPPATCSRTSRRRS